MQKQHADLFHDTTMTFGEHLEELRSSLVKALLGLMIGVTIGLFVGDDVVELIKAPLEKALASYYKSSAVTQYEAWAIERKEAGLPIPYTVGEIKHLVDDEDLVFELRYLHPAAVEQLLDAAIKSAAAKAENPITDSAAGSVQDAKSESAPAGELTSSDPAASQSSGGDGSNFKQAADAVGTQGADAAGGAASDVAAPIGETEVSKTVESKAAEVASAPVAPRAALLKNRLEPIFLWQPSKEDDRIKASTLSVQEAFTFWIKASMVVGLILSSPWVFYQIWSFVAAGLYPHEKKHVHFFLPFSLGLFLAGASLAYLFVFEPVLNFLFDFNRDLSLNPDPRISEWMNFVLFLPLGFGISFQLPLVMLFLERLGILTVKTFIEKWRIAILVIFVLSAVLTPADPYSLLLMAVPLTFLYFGGILLCKWLPRSQPRSVE